MSLNLWTYIRAHNRRTKTLNFVDFDVGEAKQNRNEKKNEQEE